MKINFEKILVLAPHTDDGEIGCGASINKFVTEGKEVHYVAFSSAGKSLQEKGLAKDTLIKEVSAATRVLGIPPENLHVYDFDVREFPSNRQKILNVMIGFKRKLAPDLVMAPSLNDIHQDHEVVAREALRAFKNITILGYEMPWNNISFETKVFIKLEKSHIDKKVEALKCYKSQQDRSYLDEGFIRSLAKTRGVQIESDMAESFEVMRLVL